MGNAMCGQPGSDGVRSRAESWFHSHHGAMLAYASRMLGDRDVAQDVVQDAFVRLLREDGKADAIRDGRLWLFKVTHNLVLDHKKRLATRKTHAEEAAQEPPKQAPAAAALAERTMTREVVEREIKSLPGSRADVVYLRVIEGLSYAEIADVTGLTSGNVGFHLHHGMRELTQRLVSGGVLSA